MYLYGEASEDLKRKSVPQIRAGEYEGLPDKVRRFACFSRALVHLCLSDSNTFSCKLQISKSEWKPNFGPADFVPNWGATIAGARKFLIAYNINMLATKEQAHRIALNIREQGRGQAQVDIF